jgi:hypothetical protein
MKINMSTKIKERNYETLEKNQHALQRNVKYFLGIRYFLSFFYIP